VLTDSGRGLYGDEVSRESFPLPTLEAKLDAGCRDVHEGRGFVVLRGLDPQRYSKEDNINIYLGVAAYIGDIRGIQNKKGDMLGRFFTTKSSPWPTSVFEFLRLLILTRSNKNISRILRTGALSNQRCGSASTPTKVWPGIRIPAPTSSHFMFWAWAPLAAIHWLHHRGQSVGNWRPLPRRF